MFFSKLFTISVNCELVLTRHIDECIINADDAASSFDRLRTRHVLL